MIAHYDEQPDGTIVCWHLIMTYDDQVLADAHKDDKPFIHLDEPVRFDHLKMDRCPDTGAVRAWCHPPDAEPRLLRQRQPLLRHELTIEPAEPYAAGAEIVVHGVPAGARIMVNNDHAHVDVMDASGVYEVTLADAGRYHLRIEAEGYSAAEILLDAA